MVRRTRSRGGNRLHNEPAKAEVHARGGSTPLVGCHKEAVASTAASTGKSITPRRRRSIMVPIHTTGAHSPTTPQRPFALERGGTSPTDGHGTRWPARGGSRRSARHERDRISDRASLVATWKSGVRNHSAGRLAILPTTSTTSNGAIDKTATWREACGRASSIAAQSARDQTSGESSIRPTVMHVGGGAPLGRPSQGSSSQLVEPDCPERR